MKQMSRLNLRFIVLGLFFATLSACSFSPQRTSSAPVLKIDQIYLGSLSSAPAVVSVDDKIAMLYPTPENRVAFRLGDKTQLLDGNLKVKGGQFFQLRRFGQTLYALWWSHQDEKNLYCAVSTDGGLTFAPTQIINTDHGVLPPFTVVSDGGKVAGVAYMDEREPRFEVYFTHTMDQGQSWVKPDVRLDTPPKAPEQSSAMFPQLVQAGKNWIVTWTDTTKVDGSVMGRVLERTSSDAGKSWSPERVLYQSQSLLTGMITQAKSNNVVILFQDTLKGVVAIGSADDGANWKIYSSAPESFKTNNSGFRLAMDGEHGYVVWMAQALTTVQGKPNKADIMAATFNMKTGLWVGQPQRIDVGKPVNLTSSLEPDITVTSSGAAVIAWTDFRDIRPNIYLSASFDQGKTWTAPQDIEQPGEFSAMFPKLLPKKDSVLVSYEKFPSDSRKVREAIVSEFPLVKPAGFGSIPTPNVVSEEKKASMLKSRVDNFWKLRTEGKFAETYEYFDPAFKNAFTPEDFVKHQGNFVYHSATIEKTEIQGNVAEVTDKVNYEVKATEIAGQTVKIPPTTVDIKSTWLWIYDNWYELYQPPFGAPLLNY